MNDFSVTIGIWVVSGDGPPSLPPEQRPIGRAALALRKDGIQVVFGDKMVNGCMDGYTAIEGGWTRQSGLQVNAVHDRFPSQMRADQYQDLIDGLHGCPLGNSRDFTLLCRDKIDSQQALVQQGIQMPPIETNPDQFADRLKAWGSAFIKPRFGALGTGVARVRPGDPLPRTRPGMIPGTDEPAILQCAVPPPQRTCGNGCARPGSAHSGWLAHRGPRGSLKPDRSRCQCCPWCHGRSRYRCSQLTSV